MTELHLGSIITQPQQRDAIHIAVAPVIAAAELHPGQHVGLDAMGRAMLKDMGGLIGIVDPFLRGRVQEGEQFWLFLYPNTITGLRHDWLHPNFPATGGEDAKLAAKHRIMMLATACGKTYGALMDDAQSFIWSDGEHIYDNSERYKDGNFSTFWTDYEIVTGQTVDASLKSWGSPYTCSC